MAEMDQRSSESCSAMDQASVSNEDFILFLVTAFHEENGHKIQSFRFKELEAWVDLTKCQPEWIRQQGRSEIESVSQILPVMIQSSEELEMNDLEQALLDKSKLTRKKKRERTETDTRDELAEPEPKAERTETDTRDELADAEPEAASSESQFVFELMRQAMSDDLLRQTDVEALAPRALQAVIDDIKHKCEIETWQKKKNEQKEKSRKKREEKKKADEEKEKKKKKKK